MTTTTGDMLPDVELLRNGEDGPEPVSLSDLTKGREIVLFGLPGAFTGTCTTAHVPSFIRTKDAFAEKGVDAIYGVAANDPFVMGAFGEATGATEAGIEMLSDAGSALARAMGRDFDFAPHGMLGRIRRFALVAENGKITVMHEEAGPGICDLTAGESLLDAL
ncbi:MAG: peroxiredoxin [Rhodobacteraceae bacterium]|nr:peroxiredoxin [Paracoccaceae bacterium]